MKYKNLMVLLTSLLLGAAVVACAGNTGGGGDDENNGGGAGVGDACGGNSDCDGSLQCLASQRVCVQTCTPNGSDCGSDACIPLNDSVGYCDFGAADGNNGAGNNGPVNNGVGNNGPANNGPANNGPANNGPANNGPANNGPANNGGGTNDCPAIYECIAECGQDQACGEGCFNNGSPDGQAAIAAMLGCFNDLCADAMTDQEFQDCALNQCGAEVQACFGGGGGNNGGEGELLCLQDCAGNADCPNGQSCVDVTGQGNMQCVEGQNVPADAPACDANGMCAAGSTCYQVGGGGGGGSEFCVQDCSTDADCRAGETCFDAGGVTLCAVLQNGQPFVPQDAAECNAGQCNAGYTCVQTGG